MKHSYNFARPTASSPRMLLPALHRSALHSTSLQSNPARCAPIASTLSRKDLKDLVAQMID